MHSNYCTPLANIFTNTKLHQAVADIILKHSTNKVGIMDTALKGLSFDNVETALDVGCGFGLFTRSMKGILKSGTSMLGIDRCNGNRLAYLESCKTADLNGSFDNSGVDILKSIAPNTFDLVLCSFALYFFTDYIPQISRVLKPTGTFLVITHSSNHLCELFSFFKKAYKKFGFEIPTCLPYEKLINNFNDNNGTRLLDPYFSTIQKKYYHSSLIFDKKDFNDLEKYFQFKQPFYLPGNMDEKNFIFNKIIDGLRQDLTSSKTFNVTKDDIIFRCRKPKVE
ncbi:MAG: class I SAM-dependent methyltransferase [Bacteroidetes bacterium]|nr:class I SAM-dependent methyltransferase [Bacteroidota bacterium]